MNTRTQLDYIDNRLLGEIGLLADRTGYSAAEHFYVSPKGKPRSIALAYKARARISSVSFSSISRASSREIHLF
jgi:hypothetical protein